MAFADFLDLRTAVLEQVGRTDIADKFPRITKLAEARLDRDLTCREQVTETTLSFVDGAAALPSDFGAAIGLYDANGLEYVQQPLQAVQSVVGRCYYAVDGANIVASGAPEDLTLQYYAKIPTITGSLTSTNWLLEKYPSLYLYAVSFEAAKSIRDLELAADMKALYGGELGDVEAYDARQRYSRARVRVQGPTP